MTPERAVSLRVVGMDVRMPCEHPDRRVCHARAEGESGPYWHAVRRWSVLDCDTGRPARYTEAGQFTSHREATTWMKRERRRRLA